MISLMSVLDWVGINEEHARYGMFGTFTRVVVSLMIDLNLFILEWLISSSILPGSIMHQRYRTYKPTSLLF